MTTLTNLPLDVKRYILFREMAAFRAASLLTGFECNRDWHEEVSRWAMEAISTLTAQQIDIEMAELATDVAAFANPITLIAEPTPDGVSYHLPPSPPLSQELLTAIAAHGIALSQAVSSIAIMSGRQHHDILTQVLSDALRLLDVMEPDALKSQLDVMLTSAAIAAHHVKSA